MKTAKGVRVVCALILWSVLLEACYTLVGLMRLLATIPDKGFRVQVQHLRWVMTLNIVVIVIGGAFSIWGTKQCFKRLHP